jgi:GT2 family glycosyltransferase
LAESKANEVIDVLIVIYRPDLQQFEALLTALLRDRNEGLPLSVKLWVNDETTGRDTKFTALCSESRLQGLNVEAFLGERNIGFGSGINALVEKSAAPYVLALNQDAIPEPNAIPRLWKTAQLDDAKVAAWEMRQIPYEHPKLYDPVTLDTEWFTGAATLIRTSAFREVGGFESRIFMYGEDVDLSWRLRCAGYRLRYFPRAAVVHHTYSKPEEVKPLQALEGIYVNLCLRTRYSGHRRIAQGLTMAIGELMMPPSFAGRRRGIARAIWKFVRNYRYFWKTQKSAPGFEPRFSGWGYEIRRDGAFHVFKSQSEQLAEKPLVSVLIRTHRRGAFLRQALQSVANQTYRPIEAVVVEDGSSEGENVCCEFANEIDVRYYRLETARGRSVAGNLALSSARGQWFCFLDDDDQFFADHVEVLLAAVQENKVKGAYSLAWRTSTLIKDIASASYEETSYDRVPDEPFSRVTLWHHNFMPIQAVLFHRSLYEQYGGFAEDMDQLEDWNLWTRYTIVDDFVQVRKLTSKYRVPSDTTVNVERQSKLDDAYRDAVKRQSLMTFPANPSFVRKLAEDYARSNAILHIGRDQVRQQFSNSPVFSKIFALRLLLRKRIRGRA